MTINGGNLDSVAQPRINLTVIVTRFDSGMNVTSLTSFNSTEVIIVQLPCSLHIYDLLFRIKFVTFPSKMTVVLYPITNTEMHRPYLTTAFIVFILFIVLFVCLCLSPLFSCVSFSLTATYF